MQSEVPRKINTHYLQLHALGGKKVKLVFTDYYFLIVLASKQ